MGIIVYVFTKFMITCIFGNIFVGQDFIQLYFGLHMNFYTVDSDSLEKLVYNILKLFIKICFQNILNAIF